MADETYYSLLEVSEVATATEIKAAYIRLIREVHPDRLANAPPYWQRQAEEKSKEVNEAYTVLSDREKRRLYDAQLALYRSTQATNSGPSSAHHSSPNTTQQQTPPRPPKPAQAQQQAQQQPPQAAATQAATGRKVPGSPQKIQSGWKRWFWSTWTISGLMGLAIGQIGETGTPTDHRAVLTGVWYWIGGLPLALVLASRRDRIKQWTSNQRAAGVLYETLGAGTAVAFMLFFLSMLPVMSDLNKDRTKVKAPIDQSAGFVRKAEVNEYSTPIPPGATAKQQNPTSKAEPAYPFDEQYGGYVQTIKNKVAQNWRTDEVAANTTAGATVYITFPIGKMGYPGAASIKASSGWQSLDKSCLNAVGRVGTFGPLPAGYQEKTLNVVYHCTYLGLSVGSAEVVAIEKRPSPASPSEQTTRALISKDSDPAKAQSETFNNSVSALSKMSDASTLNSSDRASIESACSGARLVQGAAAYHRCLGSQLRELAEVPNSPDLSQLRAADRDSIESACSGARLVQGAAAYHRCLGDQLRELAEAPNAQDLRRLNASDLASIESACSGARLVQGAAAYHRCLVQQLGELAEVPNKPDLSRLNASDRASIESACSGAKLVQGAAAYHRCLKTQLSELEH